MGVPCFASLTIHTWLSYAQRRIGATRRSLLWKAIPIHSHARLQAVSGVEVGRIEATVYDAYSAVLKYIVVNRRAVPADNIEVDVAEECVRAPYSREIVRSVPALQTPSGEFDRALHAHYEDYEGRR